MVKDEHTPTSPDLTGPAADDAAPTADDPFFGRMNDPSGSAFVRGACGDEMEFYLDIRGGVICEARYYTEGCADTHFYGRAAAEAAQGKSLPDALAISPRQLMDQDASLTEQTRHCAILAVITLYRAIAEFLLQP